MPNIPLANPTMSKEMIEAAASALESEFMVGGESVEKFEEEFAAYIGTKHAVSCSSGTNALSMAMEALKVKGNVITTPMSFIATSNAIIHAGATPVFCDIDSASGTMDATAAVEKANATENVDAVLPVHLYGNPANVEPLKELQEKGVKLIEDACQAHGASVNGVKCGALGDVGCFSFYTTKNMTVGGDGGMITTNNEEVAERIKKLRNCGRVSKYEHDVIGYTARLNTVNAAIGRIQLKHLDEWNEKRRASAALYKELLPKEVHLEENGEPVYYTFTIRTPKRDAIMESLKKNDIDSGIYFPIPIHLQPAYKEKYNYEEGAFPKAEAFAGEIVSLPMFPDLTPDEVKRVCEAVNEVLE